MVNPDSFPLVGECTLNLGAAIPGQPSLAIVALEPRVMEHTRNSKSRNSAALVKSSTTMQTYPCPTTAVERVYFVQPCGPRPTGADTCLKGSGPVRSI